MATAVRCLTECKTLAGQEQKLYTGTQEMTLQLAMMHLTGMCCRCL